MNFSRDFSRTFAQKTFTRAFIPCFFILLISVLLLVSCQTTRPAVSLDEARQITVAFSGTAFVPPPRSINDLRPIIGAYYAGNKVNPCISLPPMPLEEISKKYRNAPSWPHRRCRTRWLDRLASTEMYRGNYSRSVELLKMAIMALPLDVNFPHGYRFARLAKLYAYAGDFTAAKKALSSASSWFGRSDYQDARKHCLLNSANGKVEQLKGNLSQAEQHFRNAIKIEETHKELHVHTPEAIDEFNRAMLNMDLAENLMLQGRLVEAEITARELVTRPRFNTGNIFIDGGILLVLSRTLFEQGRYHDAEYAAKASVNAYLSSFDTACSSVFLNIARQTLARSLMAQERWDEAVMLFELVREAMADDPEAFQTRFAGNVDWALSLMATGRTKEAIDMLEVAYDRTVEQLGEKDYQATEIRGFIACAHTAAEKREQALNEFSAAVPKLLSRSRRADEAGLEHAARDQRRTFILESYIGLLADIQGTGIEAKAGISATDASFPLADAARDQSVLRALGESSSRAAIKDPELSDLARREQDSRKQIQALYGVLAGVMAQNPGERNPEVVASLRRKIEQLKDANGMLIKEIESRFPEYIELINPKPAALETVRSSLFPDEAMVSIYIGRGRSFVWAVSYEGDAAFASVPLDRHTVKRMVAKVRTALEPNAERLGEIPAFDLDTAHRIYRAFLEPVLHVWQDAKKLIVVSHGTLGYLPFSLLPTGPTKLTAEDKILFRGYQKVPWLVRTHTIAALPSVASLVTLRSENVVHLNRNPFVGFGDPYFSEQQAATASLKKEQRVASVEKPDDYGLRGIKIARLKTEQLDSAELALLPRLPETADEVRSIALALNADETRDVFTGVHANEHQVKTLDLSGYKVIAFATHGLAPGDINGLLQPALALTAPKVAGIEGDGLLTMGEILGLRLNADWVVLSACNTGAGKEKGAEAFSGLGRAFFYAGASALLVSNWPVETTSAKALTTNLFERQAKNPDLTRAEALRESMQSLIDGDGYVDPETGKIVFSYAHPIFWAPFTIVGD
jgi:CHAT domain-containing protein